MKTCTNLTAQTSPYTTRTIIRTVKLSALSALTVTAHGGAKTAQRNLQNADRFSKPFAIAAL